ncbi:hypothetical protein FB567DRAFT_615487 [Paraphoma chrysanthemicola]|uniref:Uncharacterized protein n=1 Tax=Paraphoma chrysanthemicola TaxID=798071 RepID=A0A8K0QSA4_9PLEO|nr:hypothetical protein FB567DRAFT_615487 [Paraphoma chrysanthemicola]
MPNNILPTPPSPTDQHHPTPGNPQTHACPMPPICGGTYFFSLPLSQSSLDALPSDDLASLVAYLHKFRQFLVEHDMQPETARYVKALIEYIEKGMVEDSGIRGLRGGAGTEKSAVYSDSDDFSMPLSSHSCPEWESITDHVHVSKPSPVNKHKSPQSNKHRGIRLKIFDTIINNPNDFIKLCKTLPDDQRDHLSDLSLGLACINGERTLTRPARIASVRWLQAEGDFYRQFDHDWSTTPLHRHGTIFPDQYDFMQRDRELSNFERNLIADGILQLTRLDDTSLVLEEAPDANTKVAHAIGRAVADEISRREADRPENCIRWDEAWRPGGLWKWMGGRGCLDEVRRVRNELDVLCWGN